MYIQDKLNSSQLLKVLNIKWYAHYLDTATQQTIKTIQQNDCMLE